MEKPASFVVPAGVVFDIGPDGLTIQNAGDIVLHTTFGRALKSVVSTEGSVDIRGDVEGGALSAAGSVTISGSLTAASVEAGGDISIGGAANVPTVRSGSSVRIGGDANVKSLHAGEGVEVAGGATGDGIHALSGVMVAGALNVALVQGAEIDLRGAVTSRGVQASRSVRLGSGRLQVDAIIAPTVTVDGKVTGRVTIIESNNELGPLGIKGGFRLADYAEMFGNPASYLADRGLVPLGEAPPAPPAPTATEEPSAEAGSEPPAVTAAAETSPEPAAPRTEPATPTVTEPAEVAAEAPAAPPAAPASPRPAGVALEVEIEEAEDASMQPAPAPMPAEHPLHRQLIDAVTKIAECYTGGDLPPAVSHLMQLIESRSYDQVRAEITTIWSELLKFHQKKGMRIQHQVTTTFNTINSLVKKM